MLPILLARARVPAFLIGIVFVLASPLHHLGWLASLGAVLVLASVASMFLPGLHVKREPISVESPVHGRWIAVNSPANKVPSHGVHSAGQTYAIDLVYWPDESHDWNSVHTWPIMQPPNAFPGFGQPISAPADGTVIRVSSRWRDHWSRNSRPALLYMFAESMLRELLGPGGLLGNHVILDLGDGTYAVLAHLKRKSISVTKGQTVTAGQQLAECGNSGNTSEPHIHFQLMDNPHAALAAGLPFSFAEHEMPRNERPFVA